MSTKELIFKTAYKIAEEKGINHVSVREIREESDVAHGSIFYYYPSLSDLRDAVILHALEEGNHTIIGHAVMAKHPLVKDLDHNLKIKTISNII